MEWVWVRPPPPGWEFFPHNPVFFSDSDPKPPFICADVGLSKAHGIISLYSLLITNKGFAFDGSVGIAADFQASADIELTWQHAAGSPRDQDGPQLLPFAKVSPNIFVYIAKYICPN